MKQKAYLYIRVSTDEQAEKGYSQKHQDDRLRQYCEHHNIEIVGSFWEDYSGKTFDRPEFNKFIEHLKRNRISTDSLRTRTTPRFEVTSSNFLTSSLFASSALNLSLHPCWQWQ